VDETRTDWKARTRVEDGQADVKILRATPNDFANRLCIHIFAKKSTKLLSNGLANELCIFINLAKSWDGLAYMQAHDRLDIPSHALLSRALFPPAPPGFLF
jgi:hypothetical protein